MTLCRMYPPARLSAVASGEHMDLAWHVQRVTGTQNFVITISGWFSGQFTFTQLEMQQATRGKVKVAVEVHHAELTAAKARRAGRASR